MPGSRDFECDLHRKPPCLCGQPSVVWVFWEHSLAGRNKEPECAEHALGWLAVGPIDRAFRSIYGEEPWVPEGYDAESLYRRTYSAGSGVPRQDGTIATAPTVSTHRRSWIDSLAQSLANRGRR
jgi:hypothetical protein